MPPPPPVGFFTRYVLENPWPLGIVLFAVAVIAGWRAMRGGSGRLGAAGVVAALGVAVLIAGAAVVTSGERARQVVLQVVDAAVAGDVGGASSLFAGDATLALGSTANPGFPREAIEQRLDHLDDRYRIDSNDVTTLRAYSTARQAAVVHLACRTVLAAVPVPVPTEWVVEVTRQDDGTWKISRVTWISIAGRSPTADLGL
jgi:hypothetical protein